MLDSIPTPEQLAELVGKELYEVWHRLCARRFRACKACPATWYR